MKKLKRRKIKKKQKKKNSLKRKRKLKIRREKSKNCEEISAILENKISHVYLNAIRRRKILFFLCF